MGDRSRQILASMGCQHPWHPGSPARIEIAHQHPATIVIEPVEYFIEQQQARLCREGARDEGQPQFAIRECQYLAARERFEAEALEKPLSVATLPCVESLEHDVGAMDAGADQLEHGQIPLVALVLVLALGTNVRNQLLRAERLAVTHLAYDIAAPATSGRCRPDIARDQFQQLGLAGAVGAEQRPSLARANAPIDVAKNVA